MTILFLARPDLFSYPGGDTVQVANTAQALRALGVTVDVLPERPDYERYDLLHFFNLIDPEHMLGHLASTDRPYVVSTVHVDYSEYDRYHRGGPISLAYRFLDRDRVEYLKTVTKWLLGKDTIGHRSYLWKGQRASIREVLAGAACWLPNSGSEYRRVAADYGLEKAYRVVPNGIDPDLFTPRSDQKREGVLCVARIEGQKNTRNLIRALRGTGLDLYLVGQPALNQPAYYRTCRALADEWVHFIGRLPQTELLAYYERARVHVLPSWFETTGLTSLEAAAMGCNIVVGDRGDVRDYFQDDAWYCEPGDPASIREAVLAANEAPADPTLAERVRRAYTWSRAGEATLAAYRWVLGGKG